MPLFEIFQCMPQRFGFVGADALDEMHQCGPAITDVRGLVEGIDHEPGHQFVATVHRCVSVRSIITNLDDEILAGQALQHCHHSGVRQVALDAESFVNLTHGLGRGRVPQVVHHRPF